MGLRRRLKQELRRSLQLWHDCWRRIPTPYKARRERQKLASIQNLSRVQEIHLPQSWLQGTGHWVLFSHFHPQGWLQRCIRRELADLRARGWAVLLLSNQLDDDALAWCQHQDVGWLRRANQGRDFGAFQDGWLALQHQELWQQCKRLILLNDSVYPVVDLASSSWPRFLEGAEESVVGFSDSFQNGYHLQSYGLHVPGWILQTAWWDSYWRTYPGWGGMTVAIRDGEVGLSQLLMRKGVSLRALHSVSRLRAQIASAELLEKLMNVCSEPAAVWIQHQLLSTGLSSLNFYSPAHYWAIPLLLDGCPFLKRWLLESNEEQMLDPLLVAGGPAHLVDPQELADYLRPPIIGFAS